MNSLHDLLGILPVIVSLVVIEALLSVDNALAMAALAAHLPKPQQAFALRIGLLGAYLFRGLAMFLASLIIASPWLKIVGAAYLLYLMSSNLVESHDGESGERVSKSPPRGLFMTVLQIEVMDLTLSLDNVAAAVAFDSRLWVVCTGVFIGILALRLLAGLSLRLLEKFPVLGPTAFLLLGYVGVILSVEVGTALVQGEGHGVHVTAMEKFAGIVTILSLALFYDGTTAGRAVLRPLVVLGIPMMRLLDKIFGVIFWPAAKCIYWGKVALGRKLAATGEIIPP